MSDMTDRLERYISVVEAESIRRADKLVQAATRIAGLRAENERLLQEGLEANRELAKQARADAVRIARLEQEVESYQRAMRQEYGKREALEAENERLREALRCVLDNWEANAGPRGHHVGCVCSGSNDGEHSCATLVASINAARAALEGK